MTKAMKTCACKSGCTGSCGCRKRNRLCLFCPCGDRCSNRGGDVVIKTVNILPAVDQNADSATDSESGSDESETDSIA